MSRRLPSLLRGAPRAGLVRAAAVIVLVGLLVAAAQSNGFARTRLRLQQGLAWLPTAHYADLVQVNGSSASVAARTKVAASNELVVTQLDGGSIVANRDTAELVKIDASEFRISPALKVDGAGRDLQVMGATDNARYAVSPAAGVVRGLEVSPFSLGAEIVSAGHPILVTGSPAGTLWVLDPDGPVLLRLEDGRITGRRSLAGPSLGTVLALSAAGERPVLLTDKAAVVIDPSDLSESSACTSGPLPWTGTASPPLVDQQPSGVQSVVPAVVADRGRLVLIDLNQRASCPSLPLAGAGSPSVTSAGIYVPEASAKQVRFLATGAKDLATVSLPFTVNAGDRLQVFEHEGYIWLNDLDGTMAALLQRAAVTAIPKFPTAGGGSGVGATADPNNPIPGPQGTPGGGPQSPSEGNNPAQGGQLPSDKASTATTSGTSSSGSSTSGSATTGAAKSGSSRSGDSTSGKSAAQSANGGAPGPAPSPSMTTPSTPNPGPAPAPATAEAIPSAQPDPRVLTPSQPTPGIDARQPSTKPPEGRSGEFTLFPLQPRAGETVQLVASDGTATHYEWTASSGRKGSGRLWATSFATAGTYQITLNVGYADSTSLQKVRSITVLAPGVPRPPQVAFGCEPDVVHVGEQVRCTDQSLIDGQTSQSRRWTIDGESSSSDVSTSRTWNAPGDHVVALSVTTADGTGNASRTISVLAPGAADPLQARYAVSRQVAAPDEELRFADQSRGGPTSWRWDFGDGFGSTTQNPAHRWKEPGTYTVSLRVADGDGRADTFSGTITIASGAVKPVARMDVSPENLASVDEAVTVTDSSYPQVDSVTIDWGNGKTQSVKRGSTTPYRYDKNGTYTITLIASNTAGSDSVSQTIRVGDLGTLTPSFITSPTKAVAGQSVMFIDTSAGGPTSWSWSFGDGGSGDGPVATHVFAKEGTYEVTLKVARFGAPQERKLKLQVGPSGAVSKPTVWITGPAYLSVNQSVAFHANATGDVKTITWDFGEGVSASGADVTHAFSTPGPKMVKATATGPAGSASDAFALQVDPLQPLHVNFVMNPAVPVQNTMLSFTNLSTGNPDSFTWSTSGGVFSTSADATYFVVDQNSLTITLKACKGQVCDSKSVSSQVTPNENLVAIFTFAPAPEIGVGETVAFNDKSSGRPDRLTWTFGDDNSSSAQRNPTHVFAKEGVFPVTLMACRGTQCATSVQAVTVKANAVPGPGTVSVTATPAAPTAGQTVTLTAAISPDPPVSANWTINGVSVTSSGVHKEYVMQAVPQGTYDIILSVCWNADRGLDPGQGNCQRAQKSLVVNPVSPTTPPNPATASTTASTTSPPSTSSTTSSSTTSSTSTTSPTSSSSTATTSPTTSSSAGPTTSSTTTTSSPVTTSAPATTSSTTASSSTTTASTSSSAPPSSSGSTAPGTSSTTTSGGSTPSSAGAGGAPGAGSTTKP